MSEFEKEELTTRILATSEEQKILILNYPQLLNH
jgi:hypothetical protein